MKNKNKTILIFLIVLSLSFLIYSLYPKETSKGGSSPTINITYENLAEVLSKTSMVKDIPKNSEVLLRFYNFNSEGRIFEESFILKTQEIIKTTETNSEVIIMIHSKYLSELTNKNLCSILKKANMAGDLEIETELSSSSLVWKFKSMLKYKNCLI